MGATSTRPAHRDRADTHAAETEQAAFRLGHSIRLESMIRTGTSGRTDQRIRFRRPATRANGVGLYSLWLGQPRHAQRRHGTGKAIRLGPQSTAETLMTARIGSVGRPRPIGMAVLRHERGGTERHAPCRLTERFEFRTASS